MSVNGRGRRDGAEETAQDSAGGEDRSPLNGSAHRPNDYDGELVFGDNTNTGFLVENGYKVAIIGGKHFTTPEGEYVEMKNGGEYSIYVANLHGEGCTLNISIDGFAIGTWTLKGCDGYEIERPTESEEKFIFYRVKQAPSGSGIEMGKEDNGLIEFIFTPEAEIPVIVSTRDLPEPIQFQMPPYALIMNVKFKAQDLLDLERDVEQVLIRGNQILDDDDWLRDYNDDTSEVFQLISKELKITIETSTNREFTITVQPGECNVRDVMDQIEECTDVNALDQELFYGDKRISDDLRSLLPVDLMLAEKPLLKVILPECINVVVQLSTDDEATVKISKSKTLRDLRQRLYRHVDAFVLNGVTLEVEGTIDSLQDCGIVDGSVLVVKKYERAPRNVARDSSAQNSAFNLGNHTLQLCITAMILLISFVSSMLGYDALGYGLLVLVHLLVIGVPPQIPHEGWVYVLILLARCFWTILPVDYIILGFAVAYVHLCVGRTSGRNAAAFTQLVSGWAVVDRYMRQRYNRRMEARGNKVILPRGDPNWRAGATTLRGVSHQQLHTAPPMKVDPSREVVLTLRLVARENEKLRECKPLSNLCSAAVSGFKEESGPNRCRGKID